LSTSTLTKTAFGYLRANCSKTGAIRWHGPHLKNSKQYHFHYGNKKAIYWVWIICGNS